MTLPINLSHLRIGSYDVKFWTTSATVLGAEVWSETDIRSSRNGYGNVASVSSSASTMREIWIRYQSGKEVKLSLPPNSSFSARPGHAVSITCMSSRSHNVNSAVGISNHTSGQHTALDNAWLYQRLSGRSGATQALANIVTIFTLGLGLIPLLIWSGTRVSRYVTPVRCRIKDVGEFCLQRGAC